MVAHMKTNTDAPRNKYFYTDERTDKVTNKGQNFNVQFCIHTYNFFGASVPPRLVYNAEGLLSGQYILINPISSRLHTRHVVKTRRNAA